MDKVCARCGYAGPFRVCGDGRREDDGRLYGVTEAGDIYCDVCCADTDRETMARDGRITLYLNSPILDAAYVTNWPGTLRFACMGRPSRGRHNIAGNRYDVWFTGPDGAEWHGVQYGDYTQLCHCKRVKKRR